VIGLRPENVRDLQAIEDEFIAKAKKMKKAIKEVVAAEMEVEDA
jgi:hypothetical protein